MKSGCMIRNAVLGMCLFAVTLSMFICHFCLLIFFISVLLLQHGAVAAGYYINQIFMPPAVQLLRFENTKILIAVLVTKFVACYLL